MQALQQAAYYTGAGVLSFIGALLVTTAAVFNPVSAFLMAGGFVWWLYENRR